jgi:hypothetical protein
MERWSKVVMRRQGVNRSSDFEVRRRGALSYYGASQGLHRRFGHSANAAKSPCAIMQLR